MVNFTAYREHTNIATENHDQTDALCAIVSLNNDKIVANERCMRTNAFRVKVQMNFEKASEREDGKVVIIHLHEYQEHHEPKWRK